MEDGRQAATGSLHARAVARVADLATIERIRNYTGLMAVFALGGGVLRIALGEGRVDSFGNAIGGDFLAFYTGAQFFLQGRASELYDLAAQLEFQRQVIGVGESTRLYPFISPPNALPFYLGFGAWSYPVALALWWIVGLSCVAASAALLRSALETLRTHPLPLLFGASFLFFPTSAWLLYGQATAIILLIYTATFVLLRRGHEFAAGACLACLAFKPQLALALAVILLVKWRWRALLGGGVVGLAWVGVGFLISPAAMWEYAELAPTLPALLRSQSYSSWGIQSLFGFSLLLLDGISLRAASVLSWVLTGGVLLALTLLWRRTPWNPASRSWDLAIAATFALGLVISPHLFLYDLMLLLLPFAIVWNQLPGTARGALLDGGPVLAWSVALWFTCFLGSYLSKGQLALSVALGLPPMALQLTTPVLLLWILAVVGARSEPRAID